MSGIVRACDVGYGHTKFTLGRGHDDVVRCFSFPSLAPMGSAVVDLMGGIKAKRQTVIVHVDNKKYEVGPEIENALGKYDERVLTENYPKTPEYLALIRGALHYMKVPQVDTLVVGLPVSHIFSHAINLAKDLTGVHPVGGSRTVLVNSVRVLAQPIGGYLDYAVRSGKSDQLDHQMNLIIDPGYFTFDFVVANGSNPIYNRSGHHDGSVSMVLDSIANDISKEYATHYTNLVAIDRGLRSGKFSVRGKQISLEKYMPNAIQIVGAAIKKMINTIGNTSDIENIILVGGGAYLFMPAIQAHFPGQEITVADDPVFANARGFHIAGEILSRRLESTAK